MHKPILRLYSVCTVHKLTHLFSSDVLNAPTDKLPPHYYLWDSDLSEEFSKMTENMLCSITGNHSLPAHAHIIANMSIAQGGLGFQHPRANAITAYMMSTKRSLQYAQQGVWLGFNKDGKHQTENHGLYFLKVLAYIRRCMFSTCRLTQ